MELNYNCNLPIISGNFNVNPDTQPIKIKEIEKSSSSSSSGCLYEKILLKSNKKVEVNLYEKSNKVAVIVDPRYDELMEAVINNFMYYMNPKGWNLMIVSSKKYKNKIMETYPKCIFIEIDETLIYYKNEIPNITINAYNSIFLNIDFWRIIPFENIAIFQKDCVMFKYFDEMFLEYDYCGANVYIEDYITFYNGSMNGGFSLRKKNKMIECLENVTLTIINEYIKKMMECNNLNTRKTTFSYVSKNSYVNEDVFFLWSCEILKFKIPDVENRKRLAIEYEPNINNSFSPAVYHGLLHDYHNVDVAIKFLLKSEYFEDEMIKLLISFADNIQVN